MPTLPADLKYRIKAVTPDTNRAKIVRLDWFTTVNDIEIMLLDDQVGVDARATDEEIIARLEQRRAELAPTLEPQIPNPEANQGLVGREG